VSFFFFLISTGEWYLFLSLFSQDEIQRLQSTIGRLETEKRQLESLATEQAEHAPNSMKPITP
jgi:hypothetical protein